MSRIIRLGISTCPNDTFAFHGLITRAVAGAPFSSAWRACQSSAVAKSSSAMIPASPIAITIALLPRRP